MRLEYKQEKNTFHVCFHFFYSHKRQLNYCSRLIENKYLHSIPFHYSLSVLWLSARTKKILSAIIFFLVRQPVDNIYIYIYAISFAVILQVYRPSRLAFIFHIAKYDAFSAIEKQRSAALYFAFFYVSLRAALLRLVMHVKRREKGWERVARRPETRISHLRWRPCRARSSKVTIYIQSR